MKKEKVLIIKQESENENSSHFPRTLYQCPKCSKTIFITHVVSYIGNRDNYCSNCGQKLDWDDVKVDVIGWTEG